MSPIPLLSVILFFSLLQYSNAQVVFFEDFEQGMPGNFTLIDADGLTPAANVAYVTEAWVTRSNFDDNSDTVACSTSWYDPAGTADDWMVTPLIHIDSPAILTWDAKAQDNQYPDGYQVRISTTGTSPAGFLANPALFSIAAENAQWTSRSVNLAAAGYKNQDVYIAFRNNSNDQFLLLVDDIMVRTPLATDARAVALSVPLSSCVLGISEPISVSIENYGLLAISNFTVSYIVNDGNNADTVTETITASIAPGTIYNYTFVQGADLSSRGTVYSINAFITLTGDGDIANNAFVQNTVANVETITPTGVNPYQSGFETISEVLGWTNEDANSDGFSWTLATGPDVASTGNNGFVYFWNDDAVTAADDWLFSTCFDLMAGKVYELSFYYRVGNAGGTIYGEKLKVVLSNTPNTGGLSAVLEDLGEVVNDFFEEHKIIFTAPASGTYYIGFHCYSDADDYYLALDDVVLGELLPPVASFTTGTSQLAVTFASTSTGVVDSVYWDFGDGSYSTSDPVVHTFAAPGDYLVCITAYNAAGSDDSCRIITVDTLSGIAFPDNAVIKIYPNPTSGFIFLETSRISADTWAEVTDITGKTVVNRHVGMPPISIDLSAQPGGIYFITITSGTSSIREKILLTR
ncbi:MAG TPA: choice-of-anchor J domain-containing protein [Chitinophagales bacterium]|nr:choice-of-anchor J domain-containing protein [Chitinophagales bacterium]